MTVNQSLFGQPAIYNAGAVTLADGQATSLQVDANGYLKVSVSGGAGADVHQEDTQHASGDYGSFALAVRHDAGGSLVNTDGDYAPLQVNSNGELVVTGGGGGTEYTEGDTDASITGKAILWEDAANTLRAVSATKPLPVAEQGTVTVNCNSSDVTIDNVSIPVTGTFWQVTQPISGEVSIGAATGAAGDLAKIEDAQHASGDVGVMALAVENEDQADLSTGDKDYTPIAVTKEGNVIVKQEGTILVTESSPLSGFATSAKQLADGHAVTVDNIISNEVYVRGSGTAGSADAAVLTVQGIASGTALAVTESSPLSGFATSAKQLAAGHTVDCNSSNVTVDNAIGAGVYVRPGTSATWDISDRAARDLGKVDIAAFDAALYTGDNVIGRVKITDGTEVANVNASNRLEISIEEDNVGLGRNETITETTATQDLSAAALSATTSIAADFRLNYVTLHFSGATTETVTITVDALAGANYDTVLVSESLTAATDMIWVPDGAVDFKSGNEIKVQCTNGSGANTVYVVVSTEER